MFIWKVEDMKLRNRQPRRRSTSLDFIEDLEVSYEDKLEFVDRMNDNMLSYILQLFRKFKEDEPSMPRDRWQSPRTQSIIAWCKRNDPKNVVDKTYRHGKINFLGSERYIQHGEDGKGPYDTFDNIVAEMFHRQLIKCLHMEDVYFRETDEYEVAKQAVRDYSDKYGTTFGMRLSFSSNGSIKVVASGESFEGPEITLEQCRILIDHYKTLETTIGDLTRQVQDLMSNM